MIAYRFPRIARRSIMRERVAGQTTAYARAGSRDASLFLALFTIYWLIAGACDGQRYGLGVQFGIGVLTWVVLLLSLWWAPREMRLPVVALVMVATCGECVGSLLWGAYRYQYHNLPLYVPPGHGLFYLAALRWATLPLMRRHARRAVTGVILIAAIWTLCGLVPIVVHDGRRPDLLGLLLFVLLLRYLRSGRDPLLFAATFLLTMGLEFYGTSLGLWHWEPILPGLHLSCGNPPAAIGAGYCVLDALSMRLTSILHRLRWGFALHRWLRLAILPLVWRGRIVD